MVDTRSRSKSRKQTPSPTNRVTKNTAQNNKSMSSNSISTRNALSNKRLPELKELCESYKVSSTGTKTEIIRRLLEYTNNSHLGDAIVVAEVHIPDELSAMQGIKTALVDITNKSSFFVREVHGRTFICNEEGLSYATAKMSEPDDKYNLKKYKEKIEQLEGLLVSKKSEKEGQWDDVRSRVISTFKRDSNTADTNDMFIIDRVNKSIHNGNAISDAGLYGVGGLRTDESAYEKLYGLLPGEVNKIAQNKTLIDLLNVCASNLLSKTNTSGNIQRLKEKMSDFAWHFRGSDYDASFLNKKTKKTELYNAYNDCLVFTKNMVVQV